MTRFERLLLWIPLLGLLAAPVAVAVTNGMVDPTSPTDRQTWVTEIRDAQSRLTQARARYDQAVKDYGRMRTRNQARGERKVDVIDEHDRAMEALRDAERNLEELMESARRAGVPPGWMREALDEPSGPAKRGN